jgi:murein DD-endopeptidase MepM/ murein hydrolase activator NlpD
LKKVFLPLFLAVLMAVTTIMYPQTGHALTEYEKITRDLKKVKQEQARAKRLADQAQKDINYINSLKKKAEVDINKILSQIEKVGKELSNLEKQIEDTEVEIQQAAEELKSAEERIDARDELLKSRLRLMYTNGFVAYMDVLLSSTSFSDFIDRYHALTSIVSQDKEILEENKQDRDLIAAKKQLIEEKITQFKELFAQAEEKRQGLLKQEKEKEVRIASLNEKEKELEDITEEQERLLMTLASKESELIKKQKTISYYSGGQLRYPLPQPYPLTSGFGIRVDPITGRKGANHKGVDFGAPNGTDILAAEAGVVIVAQWWGGYGNTVIIDHGGLWTLYAHIRPGGIKVKKGATVKRGQKIAEVGTTGKSTGYHLHFEVRKNEVPVNPMNYLK